jgi:hypothetical protein
VLFKPATQLYSQVHLGNKKPSFENINNKKTGAILTGLGIGVRESFLQELVIIRSAVTSIYSIICFPLASLAGFLLEPPTVSSCARVV